MSLLVTNGCCVECLSEEVRACMALIMLIFVNSFIKTQCSFWEKKKKKKLKYKTWIFHSFSLLYGLWRRPSTGHTLLLVHLFLILWLPVICHSGTGTLYPEMSVNCFIRCVGESWVGLQADDEKQGHGRYVPFPHSPGLLSSFPSASAGL